jgi:hypothetical protein
MKKTLAFVIFMGGVLVVAGVLNIKLTDKFDFMQHWQGLSYKQVHADELRSYTYEDIKESKDVIGILEQQLQYMIVSGDAREDEIANMEVYVERLKRGEVSVNVDHMMSSIIDKNIKLVVEEINDERVNEYIIRAIMKQESNFNPTVVSRAGAMGLMQLMPNTAKWLDVENPFDIYSNIKGGAIFYRDRLNEFGGCMYLALAAYNAGQGNVRSWLNNRNYSPDGKTLKYIPFEETRHYVPIVIKNYNMFKNGG